MPLIAALVVLLVCAQAAEAAFPGRNGRLAYSADWLYTIGPDGSDRRLLGAGRSPAWSPDGTRIAIEDGSGIAVMNADGSGRVRIADQGSAPAWSPDGTRIVFSDVTNTETADRDLYVMNANGSGRTRLTSGPLNDGEPAWSPDGTKVAFTAFDPDGDPDIHVVNADGSGRRPITTHPLDDRCPNWSPDGRRIAYMAFPDDAESIIDLSVFVMEADGGPRTFLVRHALCPAWSPDGEKIAFTGGLGDVISLVNPDGTGLTPVPNTATGLGDVDWQPLPACRDIQVGHATAKGCFTETAPGVFETEQRAWVGGFEVRPRDDGKLVLDTQAPAVRAAGAGVDVLFGEFAVPVPVEALPVSFAEADLQLGGSGSATMLLELPLKAAAKVRWENGGRAAAFEGEVSIEDLAARVGRVVSLQEGEGVGETAGKLTARLENGTGFLLDQAEVAIAQINVIPARLRVPKVLKLRNLLLRFERRDGRPFWTGRAGIELPVSGRDLTITGTVYVFDGAPAGGGAEVDGLNRYIPETPLFLQNVGGELLFAPEFGFDLRIGASLGPRIAGAQLLGLDGSAKFGSLARGCSRGNDPTELSFGISFKPLDPLLELGLARASFTGGACIYAGDQPALELTQTGTMEWVSGLLAFSGSQSGYVSRNGASLGGGVALTLPALPDLAGRVLISSVGLTACANLSFFQGGFGYRWGDDDPPSTFSGCDLAPFQVPAGGGGPARAAAAGIRVPPGLPHVAFRISSPAGAPPVRVAGPGGFSVRSPARGGTLRSRVAVVVPVPHERATYVVVRRPRAGRWRVSALDRSVPLGRVALARGLREPRVTARVRKRGRRFTLRYAVAPQPGQRVRFVERGAGVAKALGTARRRRGRIAFRPTRAPARRRTIDAVVSQNGLPRARLVVARFKAPPPRRPARPRVRARRTPSRLTLSWPHSAGASGYLVTVRHGGQTLHRLVTRKRRVRFAGTPATGRLAVVVQALSDATRPSRQTRLSVAVSKRRA